MRFRHLLGQWDAELAHGTVGLGAGHGRSSSMLIRL
jgi:hypothetical protein